MRSFPLAGPWQFSPLTTLEWLPATVPGNVHLDLMAAGRLADPFVADNEKRAQWVAEQDWQYRRIFILTEADRAETHTDIVCDGLDTLAEVLVNGHAIGQSANMFYAQRWDVTPYLQVGENDVRIIFRSPVQYVRERQAQRALPGVTDFIIPGGPYLRKAPSHYGWDWGPMLPTLGIWRDIRLESYTAARLADVQVRQRHELGRIIFSTTQHMEGDTYRPLRAHLTLTAPNGKTQTASALADEMIVLEVRDPQLWWPNDLGAQPLYRVDIRLQDGDKVLDTHTLHVGLRTIELRQTEDAWGRSFTFVVNGVPVFAKGSNWIPSDSFPARITPAHLDHLIGSAARAHHNMLRVWGGGYYEDEAFYEACDRYGILVWQDFMFSCAAYPFTDPAFLENVREEVRHAVRRLHHHPCLALWCGNNEMESGWTGWGWNTPQNADLKAADQKFFYETLRQWVAADHADGIYWPSSPSSHMPHEGPNSDLAGDNHIWEVWHALQPFSHYRQRFARFVSEFGFQSLPALRTIATYANPTEWNMTSYVMEHHQRHRDGNGKIIAYLTRHFRTPKDFESLVYVTQILQAEAMRVGVEHWRRNMARCSGALYWQLNDCWPVASWASIDYFGRWKALQYVSRRFFAPVLLSINDTGPRLDLVLSNDLPHPCAGEVRWSLELFDGTVLASGAQPLFAMPLAATPITTLDFSRQLDEEQQRHTACVVEFWQGGHLAQRALATFAPDKHLALPDPGLSIITTLEGDELRFTLHAEALARWVEIELQDVDVIFSDNAFDIPADRTVVITCPLPAGWTLAQAQAAVRVRSVRDTY